VCVCVSVCVAPARVWVSRFNRVSRVIRVSRITRISKVRI
jgi:hypothetical protein